MPAGNPVLRGLAFPWKKTEQARARSERKENNYYTFCRFLLALIPDFLSSISLLYQLKNLIPSLSVDFYVPEIQRLKCSECRAALLCEMRYVKEEKMSGINHLSNSTRR